MYATWATWESERLYPVFFRCCIKSNLGIRTSIPRFFLVLHKMQLWFPRMDIKSYKFVMQPEQPGNPNDYTPFFSDVAWNATWESIRVYLVFFWCCTKCNFDFHGWILKVTNSLCNLSNLGIRMTIPCFFPLLHEKQLVNPYEYTSFFSDVAQNATSISTDGY